MGDDLGSGIVDALLGAIESPAIRALPPYVGAVDQFADSTDILDELSMMRALTDASRSTGIDVLRVRSACPRRPPCVEARWAPSVQELDWL